MIKYTWPNIYHFKPFLRVQLSAVSTPLLLCSCPHRPSPEGFDLPSLDLRPPCTEPGWFSRPGFPLALLRHCPCLLSVPTIFSSVRVFIALLGLCFLCCLFTLLPDGHREQLLSLDRRLVFPAEPLLLRTVTRSWSRGEPDPHLSGGRLETRCWVTTRWRMLVFTPCILGNPALAGTFLRTSGLYGETVPMGGGGGRGAQGRPTVSATSLITETGHLTV